MPQTLLSWHPLPIQMANTRPGADLRNRYALLRRLGLIWCPRMLVHQVQVRPREAALQLLTIERGRGQDLERRHLLRPALRLGRLCCPQLQVRIT